jgi:molybdopterin molybdotransferase
VTLLEPLLGGLVGRAAPAWVRLPVFGVDDATARVTRLVPVRIEGGYANVVAGARPASLRAAAAADALAVLEADWTPGAPADLVPLP